MGYESIEVRLNRGDRLLLLSDGIPEAPRADGEPFGYDALRDTVAGLTAGDGWIDVLIERVRAQVRGVDDDWTAVVLQRM